MPPVGFEPTISAAERSQAARLLRSLGSPRRRWEDNIKMDLQEVVCGGMDWIVLAQDRDRWRELVATLMSFRVP